MPLIQHFLSRCGRLRGVMMMSLAAMFAGPAPIVPAFADDGAHIGMPDTIVLGRVSNNPRKHYAALDALGRYLVNRSDRITRHETVLTSDNEEMIELLRTGKVDLISESAFSSVFYEQAADARIFLRQWKGGRASYKTLFFTKKDGDIRKVRDLAGKLIAFEDAGSTSGYFVPRATLEVYDLTLKSANESRHASDIGFVFADSEVNIVAWVARGKVDAGVISDVHWDDESRAPPGLKKNLRIFHETPDLIRSVMVAGPRLNDDWLEHVSGILLGMHDDAEGRNVLEDFYRTSRFDRLIGDAKTSLDHVRSLFDRVGSAPSS